MTIYAAWAGFDGPIPGWDEGARISLDKGLVFVTRKGSLVHYCVSPDLPPGKVALVYEGDVDPREDFGSALDEFLTDRFDSE